MSADLLTVSPNSARATPAAALSVASPPRVGLGHDIQRLTARASPAVASNLAAASAAVDAAARGIAAVAIGGPAAASSTAGGAAAADAGSFVGPQESHPLTSSRTVPFLLHHDDLEDTPLIVVERKSGLVLTVTRDPLPLNRDCRWRLQPFCAHDTQVWAITTPPASLQAQLDTLLNSAREPVTHERNIRLRSCVLPDASFSSGMAEVWFSVSSMREMRIRKAKSNFDTFNNWAELLAADGDDWRLCVMQLYSNYSYAHWLSANGQLGVTLQASDSVASQWQLVPVALVGKKFSFNRYYLHDALRLPILHASGERVLKPVSQCTPAEIAPFGSYWCLPKPRPCHPTTTTLPPPPHEPVYVVICSAVNGFVWTMRDTDQPPSSKPGASAYQLRRWCGSALQVFRLEPQGVPDLTAKTLGLGTDIPVNLQQLQAELVRVHEAERTIAALKPGLEKLLRCREALQRWEQLGNRFHTLVQQDYTSRSDSARLYGGRGPDYSEILRGMTASVPAMADPEWANQNARKPQELRTLLSQLAPAHMHDVGAGQSWGDRVRLSNVAQSHWTAQLTCEPALDKPQAGADAASFVVLRMFESPESIALAAADSCGGWQNESSFSLADGGSPQEPCSWWQLIPVVSCDGVWHLDPLYSASALWSSDNIVDEFWRMNSAPQPAAATAGAAAASVPAPHSA